MTESHNTSTDGHTPGPWCVVGRETALEVVEARRNWMRVCFLTSDGACDANARLIAAAPDLLALCRELKKWLEPEVTEEPDRTYFWKLVEVIRKAEGREPLFGRPEVEYPSEAAMIRDNGDAP